MKNIFYIVNILIVDNSVILILFKNAHDLEFNDYDEFPIVEITLKNPKIELDALKINELIDLYNDGFFYEIDENKKNIKTSDNGNRENLICCDNINVIERKYNTDELVNIIKEFKNEQNLNYLKIESLSSENEKIKSFICKEIASLENKLKFTSIIPLINKKNKWKIELEIYKRISNKIDNLT